MLFYITASWPKKTGYYLSFPASTCKDGRKYVRPRRAKLVLETFSCMSSDGLKKTNITCNEKNGELMLSEIESSDFIREICLFGISNIG